MFLEGDRLVASGGADALFLLDELDPAQARALHELWQGGDLRSVPAELEPAVRDLARLGAIVPAVEPAPTLAFDLAALGDAAAVVAAVDALLGQARTLQRVEPAESRLTVLVRAGGSLLEAAKLAEGWTRPHLLVDLAYHHTTSIGPLVFPGETACLTCLAGRIRFAWGDPQAPPRALASRRAALAAGWIVDQLGVFRDTGTCSGLVARALALDLEGLTARAERVHRLPWCDACYPDERGLGSGRVLLSWAEEDPE